MPTAADQVARAYAYVSQAGDHWATVEGFDAAAATLQCREIEQMLEECGAGPNGLFQARPADSSTTSLLLDAAAALDEIPVSDRSPRLTVARSALAGALLNLP